MRQLVHILGGKNLSAVVFVSAQAISSWSLAKLPCLLLRMGGIFVFQSSPVGRRQIRCFMSWPFPLSVNFFMLKVRSCSWLSWSHQHLFSLKPWSSWLWTLWAQMGGCYFGDWVAEVIPISNHPNVHDEALHGVQHTCHIPRASRSNQDHP